MEESNLRAELQAEYFYLQKVIEDFDARSITIKAWSITFSLAAVGGAFASHASTVLLVAATSALMFWFLEAVWKSFQAGYYERSRAIEDYFDGSGEVAAPFQIGSTWFKYWHRGGKALWPKIMLWPHVALPHAVAALLGTSLFVLSVLGVVEP